jgi:DNA-binding transcriptional LysR family regulator
VNVRVEGQFTCNDADIIVDAALRGRGLACLSSDHLEPLVQEGRLVQVLEEWCPPFPGYHLCYPSRRQVSPAFRLLIDASTTFQMCSVRLFSPTAPHYD